MFIADLPAKVYTKQESIAIVAEMNEQGDDWIYVAKHDPKGTGGSIIEAYDEDGLFVGKL